MLNAFCWSTITHYTITHLTHYIYCTYSIVQKGIPAPLFRIPTSLDRACPLFLKIFYLPSFPFHPFLGYFRKFPHFHANPSCPNLTHQFPYTKLRGINKYRKGNFTNSTATFYQKSIFNFLNPFANISGYLNLWNTFRFIFRQLRNITTLNA